MSELLEMPSESLGGERTLESVGLDSLALAEFVTRIEDEFDTVLDAAALAGVLVPGVTISEFTNHVDLELSAVPAE